MFKNLEKRKIYGTILGVIGFILLAFSVSYAFYLWNSNNDNNTNVNLTISKGLENFIIYEHGNPILSTDNVTLTVGENYSSGISTTIKFYLNPSKTITKNIYGQISMKILDLQTKDAVSSNSANIAKSDTVKWAITTYTTANPTEVLLNEGTFNGKKINDIFTLTTDVILKQEETFFKVYIWLDSNAIDTANIVSGELLSTEISAEATDTISRYTEGIDNSGANYPELTDGLIPVVYNNSTNKWVKADTASSTSTYGWYDYNNKKWANAVLVKAGNSNANDLSGNGNSGAIVGASLTSKGLDFTTSSDSYVTLPSNIGATFPATYSITFNPVALGNQVIFGDVTTGASLGIYNGGSELIVALGNGGSYPNTYLTGGLSANTDYTVDLVYRSITDLDVYLNGKKLSASGSGNYWSWSTSVSYLGKRPSGGGNFGGTIKRFIVYNDALTASQVLSNYNVTNTQVCGSGIVCDNLKLYYNFTSSKAITNNRDVYLNSTAGTVIDESDILAFYVWIPRYKYKVWNMSKQIGNKTYDAENTGIDIVFESGTDSTGSISCSYNFNVDPTNGGINLANELAETCTDSNGSKYYTHPAFTFGSNDVKGFWMGKFELSSSDPTASYGGGDSTTLTPRILPNVVQWTYNTLDNFWKVIYDMQSSNNIYGLPTSRGTADSHMITNMEWGAVAYLTNSKYGRCTGGSCTEVTINNCFNSSTQLSITGTGGDSVSGEYSSTTCTNAVNKYNGSTGVLASTTGNVYGVYDMNGGEDEYVMGNMSSSSSVYNYNMELAGTNFTYSNSNKKYLTTYAYYSGAGNITEASNRGMFGDATVESNHWYNDAYIFVNYDDDQFQKNSPWFKRGRNSTLGASAGIFAFTAGTGSKAKGVTSRAVLFAY